jgi:hypothetical protein
VWLLALVAALRAVPALADPPLEIAYQGVLMEPSGTPLNGTRTIGVRIWDDALATGDENRLYEETHGDVAVVDGVFSIALGRGSAASGIFDASLFSGTGRWLEISVADEVLAPRQQILSVAYALQAQQCVDARTLGGLPLEGLVQSGAAGSVSNVMLSPGAVTSDKLDLGSLEIQQGDTTTIAADGSTGTIANSLGGDGLIKGWARVAGGGGVWSCYRCSSGDSRRISDGIYEVDFTPVGDDIHSRPWTCSLGTGEVFETPATAISCVRRAGDASSIFVTITDAGGNPVNSDFTVLVY